MTVITTIKINGRDGRTMTMDMETENGRGGTEMVVKTNIRALKRMKATELDEASEIPSFSYGQLPGTEVQVFFLKVFILRLLVQLIDLSDCLLSAHVIATFDLNFVNLLELPIMFTRIPLLLPLDARRIDL